MSKTPRPSNTIAGRQRPRPAGERGGVRDVRDEDGVRERPITAAQLAAPSTRRWRRASRFIPVS